METKYGEHGRDYERDYRSKHDDNQSDVNMEVRDKNSSELTFAQKLGLMC